MFCIGSKEEFAPLLPTSWERRIKLYFHEEGSGHGARGTGHWAGGTGQGARGTGMYRERV